METNRAQNDKGCAHKQISWSKHVELITTEMDGGCRTKVDICIRSHMNGSLGEGLLLQKEDIRVKNAEKHQSKVMEVPLKEKHEKTIVEALLAEFKDCFSQLDLKTAWLIMRRLSTAIRRDEEIARVLFCGENQELANLGFSSKFEQLEKAVKNVLKKKDLIAQKYWRFLQKLANEASRVKYLRNNPVETVWRQLRHANTREISKIIDTLRDWSLTQQQMDQMVIPLLEEVKVEEKVYHRYEVDSKVTMKVFASFGLIHKNELCALNVGDIELLPYGDAQVSITKYVDKNGKLRYYEDGGKRQILQRKSALAKLVTRCFISRKKYIKKSLGIAYDTELRDMPLFWEKETTCKTKVKRITLKTAGELYKELIADAQASNPVQESSNTLSINIDDAIEYLDIGISSSAEFVLINNIKLWTEAIFGLENGELAYNSGVEPVSTIDRHYIAWYAIYNMLATAGKLDRFTAQYLTLLEPANKRPAKRTICLNGTCLELTWNPPVDKRGIVRLEILSEAPLAVSVDTTYGHTVRMVRFNEE